jgi:pyrophosphatase PpaX
MSLICPWGTVLWDYDGTMADTVPAIVRAHHIATEAVLGTRLPQELILARIGEPARRRISALVPAGTAHDVFLAFSAEMQRYEAADVEIFEGISDLVADLFARGVSQAVVTSRPRSQVSPVLERHGLDRHLQAVIGLEDTARHKPEADPLLAGVERLLASPRDSVYVGDAAVDVLAAHNAGVAAVAVTWGAGSPTALAFTQPDHLVKSVGELTVRLTGTREASEQIG